MNATPALFRAGISSKFTKRHGENFRDTSLDAASAAKERADKRIEKQAEVIEKQQKKIESEMQKIEHITQKLHRQQVREAKRLRGRMERAASKIQRAFRKYRSIKLVQNNVAARIIQHGWGTFLVQREYQTRRSRLFEAKCNANAWVITRSMRLFACRRKRRRLGLVQHMAACTIQRAFQIAHARRTLRFLQLEREYRLLCHRSATIIQSNVRCFLARLMYFGILDLICRIQGVMRGFLVRNRIRKLHCLHEYAACPIQALYRGYRVREKLYADHRAIATSIRLIKKSKKRRHIQRQQQLQQQSLKQDQTPTRGVHLTKMNDNFLRKRTPVVSNSITIAVPSPTKETSGLSSPFTTGDSPPRRNFWLPTGVNLGKPRSDTLVPLARANPPSSSLSPSPLSSSPSNSRGFKSLRRLPKRGLGHFVGHIRLKPVVAPTSPYDSTLSPPQHSKWLEQSSWISEEASGFTVNPPSAIPSELVAEAIARRARREQELTRRLMERKVQDRVKKELDALRQLEVQRQEAEQKQMQREDKRVRLVQKETQRRQLEAKLKRQSLQQQREERERSLMGLEERRTRMLVKHLRRRKKQKAASLSTTTWTSSSSLGSAAPESQVTLESIDQEIFNFFAQARTQEEADRNDDDAVHSCMSSRSAKSSLVKGSHATFQSLSLRMPRKKKKTKTKSKSKANSTTNPVKNQNQRELLDLQALSFDSASASDSRGPNSIVASDPPANPDENDADQEVDWEYGDDFEELVDETQLNKLLCSS